MKIRSLFLLCLTVLSFAASSSPAASGWAISRKETVGDGSGGVHDALFAISIQGGRMRTETHYGTPPNEVILINLVNGKDNFLCSKGIPDLSAAGHPTGRTPASPASDNGRCERTGGLLDTIFGPDNSKMGGAKVQIVSFEAKATGEKRTVAGQKCSVYKKQTVTLITLPTPANLPKLPKKMEKMAGTSTETATVCISDFVDLKAIVASSLSPSLKARLSGMGDAKAIQAMLDFAGRGIEVTVNAATTVRMSILGKSQERVTKRTAVTESIEGKDFAEATFAVPEGFDVK